ncbi:synaptotagmin-4 isoform X2 [Hevea brasiliensis]|uniref:synaptotagmin-4 isoform X2 n=1 Tax=Hevea brasiliensis TaxID=3981 RepID=UPI0025F5CEE2|nr:synaptotagmin-4 isoform X2 [Hevea brasiliensis]
MVRRRMGRASFNIEEAVEFFNHLYVEKPLLPFLIPLVLVLWGIERWVFSVSYLVPLVVAVWATIQYCSYQRQILVEDLNRKWKRVVLNTSPITPLEHCEWLNKLFMEVWLNYINPKLSIRFSSMVEKRLKKRKSKLIERIELQEFSLGSYPPYLGLHGIRWSTSGDQLLILPVLDGKAILYSFVSTPEVRIGVAFGSGGSQSLPATELPGVSSWLVKILTETLVKTMVEPRRRCYSLPAVDLRKKAVGGVIHVTVCSASKISSSNFRGSPSRRQQNYSANGSLEEHFDDKDLQTFVEVELEQLTRRTDVRAGTSPRWDSTFNMVLHEETGILRFHLYNSNPSSVKFDYLASCEIKMKYVADDSTMFWAVGPNTGVIAEHVEFCGKEIEMSVPFEGVNSGELTVKLVLKEWQFSDGSHSFNKFRVSSQQSTDGLSNILSRTGRKINVIVVEGKDLTIKERSGKCDPYVKLQYGKVFQRTRTAHAPNPFWNQKFEFDEIGDGECLKIKCYNEEMFGDDNIGSAQVNMEGLAEGSLRDVWVPLEKVNSGELRLQIEAVRADECTGSKGSTAGSGNGWIELVLIEARDLIAADLRGTSDPYVRVQYGNLKRRTKVMYRTLNPQWNQTLEFPDDGSPLELHVKDHNALLPTLSIGDCVVEYQRLPPNQMSDKWIPLQGVKRGEIHIQITRKVPEVQKRPSLDSDLSEIKSHEFSSQMREMMNKIQSLIEVCDLEGLSTALSEMEVLEDMQKDYMMQLETEQKLLLNKIKELGQEIFSSSTSIIRRSSMS